MDNSEPEPCRIWDLVPVKVKNFATSSSLTSEKFQSHPPNKESMENHRWTCSHLTAERDNDFRTTVVEVTTVTARKKYRPEN